MTITITDPSLLRQLSNATGTVKLCGPSGEILTDGQRSSYGKLPAGVVVPFTDEQLDEFSRNRAGRPLADIVRDLEARG